MLPYGEAVKNGPSDCSAFVFLRLHKPCPGVIDAIYRRRCVHRTLAFSETMRV